MCCPEIVRSIPSDAQPPRGPAEGALTLAPDALARLRSVCDLTHPLTAEFPVFPAYRPFRATPLFAVEQNGFFAQELCFAEHTGTHLDAPAHFFVDGGTTETVRPADLVAPLAVVSIADRVAGDEDTLLVVDDLLAYERRHGRIPPRAVVALHSGWEARLAEPRRFLNADEMGVMHAPGFSREAAEWLVHERDIVAAATDTLSLDFGPSQTYEAHRALLGAGRYGLENVANLTHVPPAGAIIVVGGPAHRGGSGGPARLLALY